MAAAEISILLGSLQQIGCAIIVCVGFHWLARGISILAQDRGVIQAFLNSQNGHSQMHIERLVNGVGILQQFIAIAYLPVALVAHQQDVWSQFSHTGRLHQRLGTRLEVFPVNQRVETLDFVFCEPVTGLTLEECSLTLIDGSWNNLTADEQREVFGEKVCEVDQNGATAWGSGENEKLNGK